MSPAGEFNSFRKIPSSVYHLRFVRIGRSNVVNQSTAALTPDVFTSVQPPRGYTNHLMLHGVARCAYRLSLLLLLFKIYLLLLTICNAYFAPLAASLMLPSSANRALFAIQLANASYHSLGELPARCALQRRHKRFTARNCDGIAPPSTTFISELALACIIHQATF